MTRRKKALKKLIGGRAMWQAQVLTLGPEMFPGPLGVSLAGKALERRIWALETLDIRDFARDKHRVVDDTPAGGGPGMVMRPDVLAAAIDAALEKQPANVTREDWPVIYLSPRGRVIDQAMIRRFAGARGVTLICGRFEGVDERVLAARQVEEVSLGDFVLSGGEIAALALMDATVRLLPGVIGDPATLSEESFEKGLLEYPHYTRPQLWEGLDVPEVLISGHHERIRTWRLTEQERITRERRPDLWTSYLEKQAVKPGPGRKFTGKKPAKEK
jgi:tRNA (guanine37-N1)-methyltransferase